MELNANEMMKQIEDYFNNKTKEEILSDLDKVGCKGMIEEDVQVDVGKRIKYIGENGESTLENLTVGESYKVVNIEINTWFEYEVNGEIFTAYADEWDEWEVNL